VFSSSKPSGCSLSERTPLPIRVLGKSDTFPENRVVTLSATSRVKVRPDACLRVRKSETAHYLRQPAKALRVQESGFGARR
jgi:hypothetical protein